MSELSFLLELLLEHELAKPTQTLIRERIKEIEAKTAEPIQTRPNYMGMPRSSSTKSAQSPSTQRILDEMASEGSTIQSGVAIALKDGYPLEQAFPHETPTVIAQTPAAVAALQARQQAIAIAVSGKEEKGRTSPRKF